MWWLYYKMASYLVVTYKGMVNKASLYKAGSIPTAKQSKAGVSSGTFTGGKIGKKSTGWKTIKGINKAGKSVVAPGEKGSDKAYNKKVLNRFGL